MLSVYCDESADGAQNYVFAVAGLIGREGDWLAAEEEWLKATGGEGFHAADCEHQGHLDLYRELTQVIAQSRIGGRAVAADLTVIREYFPGALTDIGYYVCLLGVIPWFVNTVAAKVNESIEYTFDRRRESEYNASKLYEVIRGKPGWNASRLMFPKAAFATRDNPRIQMADLVARESMKDLFNQIGPTRRPRRKSNIALCTDGHISFGVIERTYCSDWRAAVDRLESGDALSSEGLRAWLVANKLADNWSNRIRYMALLDSESSKRRMEVNSVW